MHRHTIAVGHNNLLDILDFRNHALRADIVCPAFFLDIAGSCVLVVLAECLKHVANGQLLGSQHIWVDGYLILFEVASETVYFYNARNTRQLPAHNPVLNGAQLHGIIFLGVCLIHLQYILVDFPQTCSDGHHLGCTQF